MTSKWFPFQVKPASSYLRLVCFPPAGKGGSLFRSWQSTSRQPVDVMAVQLPGRETRLKESPVDDVEVLADRIVEALIPYLRLPLALFGHCYGAVIAYEVARRLPEDLVAMLCVSSCRAPHLLTSSGWSARSRSFAENRQIVRDAFGDNVADLPAELLEELMPSLLADLVALDRYRCSEPVRLGCPIHLFAWDHDHTVSPADVEAWSQYTTASFKSTTVRGNRDLLAPEGATIVNAIINELAHNEEHAVRLQSHGAR